MFFLWLNMQVIAVTHHSHGDITVAVVAHRYSQRVQCCLLIVGSKLFMVHQELINKITKNKSNTWNQSGLIILFHRFPSNIDNIKQHLTLQWESAMLFIKLSSIS